MKRIVWICIMLFFCTICTEINLVYAYGFQPPKEYSGLYLKKSYVGNFTDSGNYECLALYSSESNSNNDPMVEKAVVFVVYKNGATAQFEMDITVYFSYDEYAIENIKKLEPIFGKWNGYFYQYDLNKNGRKEIFFFDYTGLGLSMRVYEFSKDKFVSLVDASNYTNIRVEVNLDEKSFRLVSPRDPEIKGSAGVTFKWNRNNGRYEKVKAIP